MKKIICSTLATLAMAEVYEEIVEIHAKADDIANGKITISHKTEIETEETI